MTDLAPDGRARLAGKKGTGIGKVRGEGDDFFCGKRSGALLIRRKSSRAMVAQVDRKRKAQDSFCRKRAARRKRMAACGRGNSAGKREGLYRTERARAKRKAAICSGGDRGREAHKSLRKEQSRLSGGVFTKNKTPTNRGFGSASGGPHPHHPKGQRSGKFLLPAPPSSA